MKNNDTPKDAAIQFDTGENTPKRPPFKIEKALSLFITQGKNGVTAPEAHAVYQESCLHTTVSTLRKEHAIEFGQQLDKARPYRKPFMRYWLIDAAAVDLAFKLLNKKRSKRNVAPYTENWLKNFYK